jgi:hypothetical protein
LKDAQCSLNDAQRTPNAAECSMNDS